MTCRAVSRLLSAYVDQELFGNELTMVQEHLATCAVCQFEQARIASLRDKLRSLEPVCVPIGLETRLRAGLTRGRPVATRPWVVCGLVAASGIAAAFLAVFVAGRTDVPDRPVAQQTSPTWEVASDSAYLGGSDPVGGGVPVVTVGYARGQ